MNIYIVSSPGGHLNETLSMAEAFGENDVYAITLDFPNMKGAQLKGIRETLKLKLWFGYSIRFGLPVTLFIGCFSMLKMFLYHKPHMIFSSGSEIALPAFIIGKLLFRAKVVYVECFTRIHTLSLTGKIVYWFADLFLVQWPELARIYPKARYQGRLI
jgi:UDP-N-acetylglucosamine:LPS N-acetylglucosamine transferase